jgi:glycyl-tRNA synthetase
MPDPLDFQSIMMALQEFWAAQGCLIWQPYYTQVGAGTMNPATFLRVLGPEPWNVAYVEPSIRPDDGRYGENPNRMQMHYQFQVILKPDPGNPQELYLKSLEALGIDPRQHDIRFVEDNWEAPALGAWGLGWEVWLDGQEITQFTYFQQAGGFVLDPVSVEITYGLDRIAIALQRVRGFQEIRWISPAGDSAGLPALTAGDINLQAEQEHSRYYFEVGDIKRLKTMYELYEAEANSALEHGLVLPAYDYVLKCSHTFNVLDTRGAIGVTERQAFFARMRELSRRVAGAYLEQRQHLEYPWLDGSPEAGERGSREASEKVLSAHGNINTPVEFLLEFGTEELPAADLTSALAQLEQRFQALLTELRLEHGPLQVMGTPRRLVVSVKDLAPNQPDLEQMIKGPPASRAFDSLGQPTPAAEGFARSKGVAVADLQLQEMDGGKYAVAQVRTAGRPAGEVLSEALPGLIASLRFDRSMRWNSTNIAFSRPIRWLLAILGGQVVPFEYAGLHSGNISRGLRFGQLEEFSAADPQEFFSSLTKQGILPEAANRQERIADLVSSLAAEVGGLVPEDQGLLEEVANLVEAPAGLRGSFDPSFLELPREVLISVMKKHQRYFPVERENRLLPYFIAISNFGDGRGCDERELVREGNEHVIRARFADAAFFIREDLKKPLEAYLPSLGTLVFQAQLGSMLDKTHRVYHLVEDLGEMIGLSPQERHTAERAAELSKADLVSKMVVEMTSLQGIIGRYYAGYFGEPEDVGTAIFEHYLPRFAGDMAPSTLPGLVVGLADRLDTLSGLFAVGLAPSGARDPFGQRRAALGLVSNLIAWDRDFDVRTALDLAAGRLTVTAPEESRQACLAFIVERLRNLLLERGFRYDIVEAVLAEQAVNPAAAQRAVQVLTGWVNRPDWNRVLPAYARCVRITREFQEQFNLDPAAFEEPSEKELFTAIQQAEAARAQPNSVDDFLTAFLPMIPVINRFFDEVLVMTEAEDVRKNRLGLLQRVAALAFGAADMSKLEGF